MSFARRIARSERQNYIYQSRSQKFAREVAQARGCRKAQSRLAGPGLAKLGQGQKGSAGLNPPGPNMVKTAQVRLARALWAVADRLNAIAVSASR